MGLNGTENRRKYLIDTERFGGTEVNGYKLAQTPAAKKVLVR